MTALASIDVEAVERFRCFGGSCTVRVQGSGPAGPPTEAALVARHRLEGWHRQFSRFEWHSELSRVNNDAREVIPVSPMMALVVEAAVGAAALTAGLVDPTLVAELERAGYADDFSSEPVSLADALRLAPARRPAAPNPNSRWREVSVDAATKTLTRPPGVRLDSGGIAKGLFGDLLAAALGDHPAFAVDAAGDVRFGGSAGLIRPVHVASPFDDSILHTFELVRGAAATSGITRRSWLDHAGHPAHHLLDPATGTPAFTGVVQVTALAPTGTEAEALSKAALLSGPVGAHGWLPHGGVVVRDDGSFEIVDPRER
jgi:thiamine biosynthesis lipoprotein